MATSKKKNVKKTTKKTVAKTPAASKPAANKPVAKKPVANKPVAKKPAAKKPAAKKIALKKSPADSGKIKVTLEQRYKMICEAAYYISLERTYDTVNPTEDWLKAEAHINKICTVHTK